MNPEGWTWFEKRFVDQSPNPAPFHARKLRLRRSRGINRAPAAYHRMLGAHGLVSTQGDGGTVAKLGELDPESEALL